MSLSPFESISRPKTAGAGERFFYGFSPQQLESQLRDFDERVRTEPPKPVTYTGARLVPLVRTGHGLFRGGVFDGDGFVDQLALRRGWGSSTKRHIDPGPSDPVSKLSISTRMPRAFFGGYLFDHFGHFLLEGLARIIPGALDSTLPIIYFNPMGLKALPSYAKDMFAALGIDLERLVLCDAPIGVDELVTNDTAYQIRGHVNAGVSDRFKVSQDRPTMSRPIYISRTGLVGRRSILREDDLENALVRLYDVEIVRPEQMTLPDQVRKIASASTIVACAGSALHSLMFLSGTRRVHIIMPVLRDALNYMLCDEMFNSATIYVSGAKHIGEARTWEVDVECVLATLSACLDA